MSTEARRAGAALPVAEQEVVELLSDLIRIDTSNPTHPERPAAEWVAERLHEAGIACELIDAAPSEQAIPAVNNEAFECSQEERVRPNGEQSNEQPVRPVFAVVPKDAFAEQALAYSRAGFSIRQIAKKMGCGATKVHGVLKPKNQNTLKGRA